MQCAEEHKHKEKLPYAFQTIFHGPLTGDFSLKMMHVLNFILK